MKVEYNANSDLEFEFPVIVKSTRSDMITIYIKENAYVVIASDGKESLEVGDYINNDDVPPYTDMNEWVTLPPLRL